MMVLLYFVSLSSPDKIRQEDWQTKPSPRGSARPVRTSQPTIVVETRQLVTGEVSTTEVTGESSLKEG